MTKPTIILATSNGVGMGHLARASAIAVALKEIANPIIVSMAGGIADLPSYMGIRCEYIPGRDRGWMSREKWDKYLRDRLLALVEETGATVLSFDGVAPYPGVIAAKNSNSNLALLQFAEMQCLLRQFHYFNHRMRCLVKMRAKH